ncbi:MAG: hypothetical protein AAF639_21625 [Chloroflexota bacterium]
MPTGLTAQGGQSQASVWQIDFQQTSLIVKKALVREGFFYKELAPSLRLQGVSSPHLIWQETFNELSWFVIEHIPNPLPRTRWLADPQVLQCLYHLHQSQLDEDLETSGLFQPQFTCPIFCKYAFAESKYISMSIIIQRIDVEWSKKSRGAPNSTLRNQVAETYPLGHTYLEADVYLQRIQYGEYNYFWKPVVSGIVPINKHDLRQNQLRLEVYKQKLDVFSWGIPLREEYSREKLIGTLVPDSWLRIAGNVRQSRESTWYYRKYIFNIFFGASNMFDCIVSKNEPIIDYRDEVDLW